jgi:hypothetical protein
MQKVELYAPLIFREQFMSYLPQAMGRPACWAQGSCRVRFRTAYPYVLLCFKLFSAFCFRCCISWERCFAQIICRWKRKEVLYSYTWNRWKLFLQVSPKVNQRNACVCTLQTRVCFHSNSLTMNDKVATSAFWCYDFNMCSKSTRFPNYR